MPINLETGTGYYDGSGVFHPNTGLLPTPIPGYSQGIQIDPTKTFDPYGDFQLAPVQPWRGWKPPEVPSIPTPSLPDLGKIFSDTAGASNNFLGAGTLLVGVAAIGLGLLLYKNRGAFI